MWKKCICTSPPTNDPLERKAVDKSGRLGSFYDASSDKLVNSYLIKASKTKTPNLRCVSQIYSGVQSNEETHFLKEIGFDDALRQSILLQMVIPSGVCRLIDYNRPINHNTRLLYYSYRSKMDELHVEAGKTAQIVTPPQGPTFATHMITKILWGIEVLCVIQIPTDQSVNTTDQLLRRICNHLKNNTIPLQLNDDDRHFINQLTDITIFGSKTCIDDFNIPILTLLNRIHDWQNNTDLHQPLMYTMQPLRWLYNNKQYIELYNWPHQIDAHLDRIEPLLIRTKTHLRDLQEMLHNLPANFSSQTLNQQLKDYHQEVSLLLNVRDNLAEHLRKTLVDIRRRRVGPKEIENIISDQRYTCLNKNAMETFHTKIQQLFKKAILIEELEKNQIEYINSLDVRSNRKTPTTNDDIDAILKRSFSTENTSVIFWYSSDELRHEQVNIWEQIYQQLISERQRTTKPVKLVYVDFSNYRQRLEDLRILSIPSTETSKPQHNSITALPSPSLPHSVTEINVLLLGETGVGKSTFINAFINYLKFETLQQAENGKLMVLIPALFPVTVSDQLDEFIIEFGNLDSNENHEHQGQSVTRQCRSYTFDLNATLRLRLIDTPGIGDIRGTTQDAKHMNHILTYVNNLSHLNTVCLFLKPNSPRMNIFRSCVSQLLTYLTPAAYDNIIFCFTNTRTTFYTPGDTGPLLDEMFNDEEFDDISFQKENTFCFDNESFRYLAARKCDIAFDDYQKAECKNSWNTSVAELVRLLNFIQTNKPYYLEEWISPRKAALDICLLARPLMETLRVIIYNWIISGNKLVDNRIDINPNPVAIDICTHCAQINIIEVGSFWISQYQPVFSEDNTTQHHLCPSDRKNFLIEIIVKHEFVFQQSGIHDERWQSSFHNILFECDRLHHFLRQQDPLTQVDPFQPILERFLEEEQEISEIRNINSNMNSRISEILLLIKQMRQHNSQQLFECNERLTLSEVYEIINELLAIPTVKKQVDCMKRSRELKMVANEYRIPTKLIKNRTFM